MFIQTFCLYMGGVERVNGDTKDFEHDERTFLPIS